MAEINGENQAENTGLKNILEKISSGVKSKVTTNYGLKGYEYSNSGDEDATDLMNRIVSKNEVVRNFHFDDKKHTPVFLVPLSSLGYPPLPSKFDKQDTAIIISLMSRGLDHFGRDGNLSNLIVMSKKDADDFINVAKEDPTTPFSLLRKLNGGPYKREAGDAAKIDAGTHLVFFDGNGNASLSRPFPPGFNPNPA